MKKQNYTREEVISIIDDLLDCPDLLIDACQNENTSNTGKELLEIIESE